MRSLRRIAFFILLPLSSNAFAWVLDFMTLGDTGIQYDQAPGQLDSANITYGLPSDFATIVNDGAPLLDEYAQGQGETWNSCSVGGMSNQQDTQDNINKPLIFLLHGNKGSALHPQYGMSNLIYYLHEAGYSPAEVWAMSYLGKTEAQEGAEPVAPGYTHNIEDVRRFIDKVREYVGIDPAHPETFDEAVYDRTGNGKVILIGHSLGGGMAKGYLMGMQYSTCDSCTARLDPTLERLDTVKALVTVAGANYGLQGRGVTIPPNHFTVEWANASLNSPEATPRGPLTETQELIDVHDAATAQQEAEYKQRWVKDTSNDSSIPSDKRDTADIDYVAITSVEDAVDVFGDTPLLGIGDQDLRSSHLDGGTLNIFWDAGKAELAGDWDTKCPMPKLEKDLVPMTCRHLRIVMHPEIVQILRDKGIL